MLILLRPLEEGELAGVVDDGELAEEGVDDLAGAGMREDVQVLGRPSGQVEGRAALHTLGVRPPRLQGGAPIGGRHRDRASQLQLHLDEAGVGAVLVLRDTDGGVSGVRAGHRDPPGPVPTPYQAHEEVTVDLAVVLLDPLLHLRLIQLCLLPLAGLILRDSSRAERH